MMLNRFALAVVALLIASPAIAEDCPPGEEGNLCKAEAGDALAAYMVGRAALIEGNKTGDLSMAHKWAKRSKDAGFLGGKMLYKMVNLNAGQGMHHDIVEAHGWVSQAVADGVSDLEPWIRRLEAKMTPEQLYEVRR